MGESSRCWLWFAAQLLPPPERVETVQDWRIRLGWFRRGPVRNRECRKFAAYALGRRRAFLRLRLTNQLIAIIFVITGWWLPMSDRRRWVTESKENLTRQKLGGARTVGKAISTALYLPTSIGPRSRRFGWAIAALLVANLAYLYLTDYRFNVYSQPPPDPVLFGWGLLRQTSDGFGHETALTSASIALPAIAAWLGVWTKGFAEGPVIAKILFSLLMGAGLVSLLPILVTLAVLVANVVIWVLILVAIAVTVVALAVGGCLAASAAHHRTVETANLNLSEAQNQPRR